MIAYLSGAMENASDDGSEWRKEITIWLNKTLNHDVLDPVILSSKLATKLKIKNYRELKKENPELFIKFIRRIVDQDLKAVENSDYLICLWDDIVLKGAGTHGEVTYAYKIGKPIFLINKLDSIDLSSWILGCTTKIFNDFTDLKQYLKSNY